MEKLISIITVSSLKNILNNCGETKFKHLIVNINRVVKIVSTENNYKNNCKQNKLGLILHTHYTYKYII